MINERLELDGYLNGKNINPKCLYRICFLMAKKCHEDKRDMMQTREFIFDWGAKYNCYFDFNVNGVIYSAFEATTPLRGECDVWISDEDIGRIRHRFDAKHTQYVALAIIAYAKVFANKNREFDISQLALANWLGLDYGNMNHRNIKELIDFGFITKVDTGKTWKKTSRDKMSRFKLNIPIENIGQYKLDGNDVQSLYNKLFG